MTHRPTLPLEGAKKMVELEQSCGRTPSGERHGAVEVRSERGTAEGSSNLAVTLLPMAPTDVKKVHEIEKNSYPSPWPRRAFLKMLRSKWMRFFTAFADGKVVGYAGMRLGFSAHIVNIAVHRDYRRRQIGSRLLSVLVESAAKYGASRVTLEVRASNIAAQAMYRKFGFAAVAIKECYYTREKEDAILMTRVLLKENEDRDD